MNRGDDPPYHFEDQPESKPDYKLPEQDDLGFFIYVERGAILPEDGRLALAIQGQAVMVISTHEQLRDGRYRIVLSPNENWVVRSILMSGLDSSTEIELILAPRI